MKTASWMTKYGPRRVRHEPPTLTEAFAAAEGLTDDREQQIALAAELMQMPVEAVKAESAKLAKSRTTRATVEILAQRRSPNLVVVERKPARRLVGAPGGKPAPRRVSS